MFSASSWWPPIPLNWHSRATPGSTREWLNVSWPEPHATGWMLKQRGPTLKQQLVGQLAGKQELAARFNEAKWLPPAEQFNLAEGLELTFGEEKLVLYHPGPGHSPDNIVAWFPRRRVLFGGCLVRSGDGIPNVADADLEAWPGSIEKLRRFDALTIVPGHGRVGNAGLLDHTLDVIAKHVAAERKAVKE